MPDFAANAIGFYLQLDEQMSGPLDTVEKAYNRVTKAIDTMNRKLQSKANKSAAAIRSIGDELDKIPRRMKTAINKIDRVLASSGKGSRGGSSQGTRQIVEAIKKVMGFQKFAKGGEVTGGRVGIDSVPALLTPGEVVLPVSMVKGFQRLLGTPGGPLMQEGGHVKAAGSAAEAVGSGAELPRKGRSIATLILRKDLDKLVESRETYDELLTKSAPLTEMEIKNVNELEEAMSKLSNKIQSGVSRQIREMRNNAKLAGVAFKQMAVQTELTDIAIEAVGIAMDNTADGTRDAATGMLNVFKKLKDEGLAALSDYGLIFPAIAVASLTAAVQQDVAWTKIRAQLKGGEEDFAMLRDAGMSAMTDIGISTDEMNIILGKAAFFKISQKEIKPFVQIAGKATQALEQFGVGADDVTDLMWDLSSVFGSFNKNGDKTERVLEAIFASLKNHNIEWAKLKDLISSNVALFDMIDVSGGNAEKAMKGVARAAGIFGDNWISADVITDVMKAATDRDQWGNLSTLLAQSGEDFNKFTESVRAGDVAGPIQAIINSVKALASRGPAILQSKEAIESLTGGLISQADVLKILKSDLGGDVFAKLMEQSRLAAGKTDLLQDAIERLRNTFTNLFDRLKNSIIPVILDVGGRFLELGTKALTPVFWAFQKLGEMWKALPGPVKTLTAAVLGLKVAFVVFSAMSQSGAFKMLFGGVFGKALTLVATKLGLVTAGTWLWTAAQSGLNIAMALNPFGATVIALAAVAAAIGLLVYGFIEGAAWAKTLGMALLAFTGPLGLAAAAVLFLYDTFFGGGDVVSWISGIFDSVVNSIDSAIDWIVDQAFLLPKRISSFIDAIPDMFVNMFKGGEGRVGNAFGKMFYAGIRLVYALFVKLPGALGLIVLAGLGASAGLLYDAITWPFRKAWSFITGLFGGAGDLFLSIRSSLWGWLKGLVNSFLIDPINSWISGLNAALDWVPGLGPNEVGTLPRLADGGIVTKPTVSLVGEAGPEAIIPIEKLPQIIRESTQPIPGVNIDNADVVRVLKLILGVIQRGERRRGSGDPLSMLIMQELRG